MRILCYLAIAVGATWALAACSSGASAQQEEILHDSIHDLASEYKMLPLDESNRDSALALFVAKLKGVIRTKNADGLLLMLDSAPMASTGHEEHTIEKFARYWKITTPESPFWNKIDKVVGLGGTLEAEEDSTLYFSMPYVLSPHILSQYDYDFDPEITAVCLYPKVKVHRIPREDSEVKALLNYDIVNIVHTKNEFTKVQNIEGTIEGYVLSSNLMRLSGEHLLIRYIDGQWKITAFTDAL